MGTLVNQIVTSGLFRMAALRTVGIHGLPSTKAVGYPENERTHIEGNLKHYEYAAARHYLCRLFVQLESANKSDSFLVISEDDIRILDEINQWLTDNNETPSIAIPNLKGKLIEPESFASGLLNFAPPDIRSIATVRSDKHVRSYADKISSLIEEAPSEDRERKILAAMIDAHEKSEAGKRVEKIFEVASWIVKPLHYVPGVDAVLSIAEDTKDVTMKLLEREVSKKDWHLIVVKMTDIAWRDYLNRKGNLLSPR